MLYVIHLCVMLFGLPTQNRYFEAQCVDTLAWSTFKIQRPHIYIYILWYTYAVHLSLSHSHTHTYIYMTELPLSFGSPGLPNDRGSSVRPPSTWLDRTSALTHPTPGCQVRPPFMHQVNLPKCVSQTPGPTTKLRRGTQAINCGSVFCVNRVNNPCK